MFCCLFHIFFHYRRHKAQKTLRNNRPVVAAADPSSYSIAINNCKFVNATVNFINEKENTDKTSKPQSVANLPVEEKDEGILADIGGSHQRRHNNSKEEQEETPINEWSNGNVPNGMFNETVNYDNTGLDFVDSLSPQEISRSVYSSSSLNSSSSSSFPISSSSSTLAILHHTPQQKDSVHGIYLKSY